MLASFISIFQFGYNLRKRNELSTLTVFTVIKLILLNIMSVIDR